jgi:hypothetical protein
MERKTPKTIITLALNLKVFLRPMVSTRDPIKPQPNAVPQRKQYFNLE